jgi:ABC-2 type transport system permease protein
MGLAIGVVGKGISQLVGSSGAVDKALSRIAGQATLTSAYLAACMSLLALVAAAYATSAVLRLRADETDGLSEPVLASPVSRLRWGGSYLLVAAVGTLAVLVAGGFGMGLAYGVASSSAGTQIPRLLAASLVQVPAALAVGGVACALIGLLPRWSVAAGWSAVALIGLIGLFGPAVSLSQAVLDVSPLTHAPKLPGAVFSVTPVLWLSAVTVALAAIGLAGLRRRDVC